MNKPGNYEEPLGIAVRELLEHRRRRARRLDKLKAVIPGGSSVPVLPESICDDRPDGLRLAREGRSRGSAPRAVIVMDETTYMVKAIARLSYFYMHESCGQCTPCREGTGWLWRVMDRMVDGQRRDRRDRPARGRRRQDRGPHDLRAGRRGGAGRCRA